MPFGLANIPATFQAYINRALVGLVDMSCIMYLNDILIYSEDLAIYQQYIADVLEYLQKHGLFIKLSKCKFSIDIVDFLEFILGTKGIAIEQSQMQTVQE